MWQTSLQTVFYSQIQQIWSNINSLSRVNGPSHYTSSCNLLLLLKHCCFKDARYYQAIMTGYLAHSHKIITCSHKILKKLLELRNKWIFIILKSVWSLSGLIYQSFTLLIRFCNFSCSFLLSCNPDCVKGLQQVILYKLSAGSVMCHCRLQVWVCPLLVFMKHFTTR